ncbi:hypothetical protein N9A94_04960 [Akkermansiaceae bacterium]|nr:hypothetical protein [Akkermansiaceae bacterium]MDB4537293.1 hypothetical protein [Akkermansiaceae bacterium]
MNCTSLAFTLLGILSSISVANEFDNWYFNALLKGGESSVRILDKTGTEMKAVSRSDSGKLSKDRKTFIETREDIAKGDEQKESVLVRWTKAGPKTFLGFLTDGKKQSARITMNIKGENLIEIHYTTSYQYTFHGLARRQDDGRIYSRYDGTHQDAPEQRISIITWFTPNKK